MSANTIALFDALKLMSGAQGLLFALALLTLGDRNHLANRYLAVLLAILGLMPIHRFLWGTGYIEYFPAYTSIVLFLGIVIPPALFLYVRTMTYVETRPPWKWLIVPLIFAWAMQLPTHFATVEQKVALVSNTYINMDMPRVLLVSFRIYVVMAQIYLFTAVGLSLYMLLKHTRNIRHFFSYRENIELAWARNVILVSMCFLLATLILYILLPFFGSGDEAQTDYLIELMFKITDVFFAVVVFYSGVMGLLQTRIYQPALLQEQEFETIVTESGGEADKEKEKYQKSALSPEKAEKIHARLLEVMDIHKPYLESDLNLGRLAELTGSSSNHLSQVINGQLETSFFDFVNGYRVKYAQSLMAEENCKTILDIALEAAFNSKSAFYGAFKKNTGLTPAQYRRDLQRDML